MASGGGPVGSIVASFVRRSVGRCVHPSSHPSVRLFVRSSVQFCRRCRTTTFNRRTLPLLHFSFFTRLLAGWTAALADERKNRPSSRKASFIIYFLLRLANLLLLLLLLVAAAGSSSRRRCYSRGRLSTRSYSSATRIIIKIP